MSKEKQSEYMQSETKKVCEHGLEKHECEKCKEGYHHAEESAKEHGEEKYKENKPRVKARMKGLREDEPEERDSEGEKEEEEYKAKKNLPVFMRTAKGLKKLETK